MEQLHEYGNRNGFFAPLNSDGSFGAREKFEALIDVNITFSQDSNVVNADDEEILTRKTPLKGEGTVKIAQLPLTIYSKIFDVDTDANQVIIGKSDSVDKFVAFGLETTVGNGSNTLIVLYKCSFQVPDLVTTTDDGQNVRDLSLKVKCYPYKYTAKDGKTKRATFAILNSVAQATAYAAAKLAVYVPDQTLL
jgi:hypothetical protein